MIVLCATNRPGANSRKVARRAEELASKLTKVTFMDLENLRSDIFDPAVYGEKPDWFLKEYQDPILTADGMLVVVPEYNGSFPGVMKYFIDMLRFPESLKALPIAFIGVAAGQWGAIRSVEQLTHIFQYRSAHVYGKRLFIPAINSVLQEDGSLGEYEPRLVELVEGFSGFCQSISQS